MSPSLSRPQWKLAVVSRLRCKFFLVVAFVMLCLSHGGADPLEKRIQTFVAHDAEGRTLLEYLAGEAGLRLCLEDTDRRYAGFGALTLSIQMSQTTVGAILATLQARTGLAWTLQGDTLNVRPLSVLTYDDNPLDQRVPPFTFEGTLDDFVGKLNALVPDLRLSHMKGGAIGGPTLADYHKRYALRIPAAATVRSVLLTLAHENRTLTWRATLTKTRDAVLEYNGIRKVYPNQGVRAWLSFLDRRQR